MSEAEPFDVRVRAAFAFLCRVVGSQRARRLIVDACARAGSQPQPSGAPDVLLVAAARVAVGDAPSYGGLATLDRAILELADGRALPSIEIAGLLGVNRIDAVRQDEARNSFEALHPFATVDEVFRAEETWCDDELVAACRSAFDEHPPQPMRRPPDRRIRVGAIVVAIAVLVVGVVVWARRDAAAPGGGGSSAAVTGMDANSPGFALRVPAGYTVATAGSVDESPAAPGWIQIWADPGATRTSRHWFQIATTCGSIAVVGLTEGAERVEVGGQPKLLVHHADGVLEMRTVVSSGPGNLDPSTSTDLTGFGFSADAFTALVSMVVAAIGSSAGDEATPACASRPSNPFEAPTNGATPTSLRPLVDHAIAPDPSPASVVVYRAGAGDSAGTITVVTRDIDRERSETDPLRYDANDASPPDIDGATGPVRLWNVPDDHPAATHEAAVADVQDRRVTIDAVGFPAGTLATLARSARLATHDEWLQLMSGAQPPSRTDTSDSVVAAPASNTQIESLSYADVTRDTTSYGATWGLVERAAGEIGIYTDTGPDFFPESLDVDADAPVHVFASETLTIVVAALPADASPSTLVVTIAGTDQPPVALVPGRSGVRYAIFVFNELGPWTARVVADGRPTGAPTTGG